MALFERFNRSGTDEFVGAPDAASRTLSVTAVETDFVAGVYGKLASVYDWVFGPTLHAGGCRPCSGWRSLPAIASSRSASARASTSALYPRDCTVTGIDLSDSMLEKAHERVAEKAMRNVRLLRDGCVAADLPRRLVRHRLRAVPDQRRARPRAGRPRDAPRLPARRAHRHPQSLPQREPR